jgi:hypothetical protein
VLEVLDPGGGKGGLELGGVRGTCKRDKSLETRSVYH